MSKPFTTCAKRRDFNILNIAEMTEEQACKKWEEIRWGPDKQICPECGSVSKHYYRKNRMQWRCKDCNRCFSVTTNTPFADHKLSFKTMLFGLFLYTSSVKSISCIDLATSLGTTVQTAHLFVGKLRECLLRQRDTSTLKGLVHIDGGHFGGKPRKPNVRVVQDPKQIAQKIEDMINKKKTKRFYPGGKANAKRRKNRRIVMVLREVYPEKGMGGRRTIVSVSMTEDSYTAENLARKYIEDNTLIMTDENAAYLRLSQWYEHQSVEHSKEFSTPKGVNENQAESYFSRLRRCEYGVVHRITPKYLMDLANEIAWREDTRRFTEMERLYDLFRKVFKNGLSRWWRGYFQGHHRSMEILMD